MTVRRAAIPTFAALAAVWMAAAGAHAFPEQEQPGVGAVVHRTPKEASIRFNAKIEAPFSTLTIKDSRGKTVSGKSHVDSDSQRLATDLPPLAPGEYHVYWKVVAWDGHPSEGDYIFSVRP